MSKKEEVKEEVKNDDPRAEAWAKFLENYQKENPVKFEKKQANGEFAKIPVTFKGKIVIDSKGREVIL
jgi:hypothetical protein